MSKAIKYNKGFTLLEVIMSIFIVFIVIGFILQMFLISKNTNAAAKDFDIAKSILISNLELIKSSLSYDEFLSLNHYNVNYIIKTGDSAFYKFYDENWEIIHLMQDDFNKDNLPEDVKFVLSISYNIIREDKHNVIKTISTDGIKEQVELSSKLLSINAAINMYNNKNYKEILSMNAYKYFVN